MFLCTGKIDFHADTKVSALSDTAYAALRARVTSDYKGNMPEERLEKMDIDHGLYRDIIMDSDEVDAWNDIGVEVRMTRVRGLTKQHGQFAHGPSPIYQVSVPGLALLMINKTKLMEDACTDELQDRLDEGWRIIAVCPANDTRRPTYILGRSET